MVMASGVGMVFVLRCLVYSALVSCMPAPGQARSLRGKPVKVFNLMNYGVPKNRSNYEQTSLAFEKVWKAACEFNGAAEVYVPPGVYKTKEIYFVGPCKTQTPITLNIQGTLEADRDPSEYAGQGWFSFESVSGLVVTGGGTLNGHGEAIWKYNNCKSNPDCIRFPATLYLNNVKNVEVKQLKLVNSMGFNIHVTSSNSIKVDSMTITAPTTSPNTDGMHITNSHAVEFSQSVVKTGDDCVSIGPGSTNVTLVGITCGPGHGISVGGLGKENDELDVRGIMVKNCTLQGTMNGIGIKTFRNSPSINAQGFLFEDILMENVKNPIIIDQSCGTKTNKASMVKIQDVVYRNIRGTTMSPIAVRLMCSSKVPCQNIQFSNINLKHTNNNNANLTSLCSNAVALAYSGTQIPPPCKSDSPS